MCPKCDVAVGWHLEKCPTCQTKKDHFIFTNSTSGQEIEEFEETSVASKWKGELTLADVVRAQNRTTHAVRAFVRFLFIQLTGITVTVFLWNLSLAFRDQQDCDAYGSNCTGNTFLQVLATVVFIGSVIWSSNAGWSELSKSDIK